MNKRSKRSAKAASAACAGLGLALNEVLRRLTPPEEARKHFEGARIELLKGIRALVDARINHVSKRGRKGEKIEVQ